MKKLLVLVAVLLGTVTASAQYSNRVRVIVKNQTNFDVSFAPRYHMAFFDGVNNNLLFGVTNTQLGLAASNPVTDFGYQPEGVFEPVLGPGQTRTYFNNTAVGYPFQANGGASSFNTTGTTMVGFQTNPNFFYKYIRLDWIRLSVALPGGGAIYGGTLANPVPSGFSQINGTPPVFVGSNSEMVIPFATSTLSFSYNGTTVNALWTATAYVPGQVQTITILFYQ